MRASRIFAVASTLLAALVSLPVAGASALPTLSEVYYDAPGSDDGLSFVELFGTPGASLGGLSLVGINGANGASGPVVVLSGVFGSDGLFVVADRRSDGTSDVLGADLLANFDFQNGPDSIQLVDGETILDAIGYGEFDPDEVFAGEGTSAADPSAGSSLARLFANVDSDDNAADFIVLAAPTPGVAPMAPVPEPSTSLLFGLGLAGLARAGRRHPRSAGPGPPRPVDPKRGPLAVDSLLAEER